MNPIQTWPTLAVLITCYLLPGVGGAVLGVFFYGGLWWSVQRTFNVRHPGLLILASFLLRTAVTLVGFYLLMNGRLDRLAVSLIGFLLVRIVLTRRWGPEAGAATTAPAQKEPMHADHTG